MAKINILDSTIYNKIAAGEVVERPASIVKELVENALDSGAKSISVHIQGGGKKLICVSDDGCGIGHEDMRVAFYAHATSKITKIDDLYSIQTLGFRGEALASIASVSTVEMQSKIKSNEVGYSISLRGGKEYNFSEIACNNGTTIKVENLFFNTPAREKFLKKTSQEEHEITNLVSRYILIYHSISFRYIVDDKVMFQSTGSGLKDAIFLIYGKDAFSNTIQLTTEYKGMHLVGYIGKPTYFKANKTYQTVSLNGRYVQNSQISIAASQAYADYMMKRCYPFYVLELTIDLSCVDVNVHPNKMDVRFENASDIFKMIYGGIHSTINNFNRSQMQEIANAFESADQQVSKVTNREPTVENISAPFIKKNVNQLQSPMPFLYDYPDSKIVDGYKIIPIQSDCETEDNKVFAKQNSSQEALPMPNSFNIIGQLFLTYILIESGNTLFLIDQHAAHERFLYDKISGQSRGDSVQELLVPYVFSVNLFEKSILVEKLIALSAMGFTIVEFGENAFRVESVPLYFSDGDISAFISDILTEDKSLKKIQDLSTVKDMLMQKACKSAIKAGKKLSNSEIEELLSSIQKGNIQQCPHGRPIVIKISKNEIEKWFKRVL